MELQEKRAQEDAEVARANIEATTPTVTELEKKRKDVEEKRKQLEERRKKK